MSPASTNQVTPTLPNRVVVVTGGSSGIGASLAVLLANEGAAVVIAGRRNKQLQNVAAQAAQSPGSVIPRACDVTDRLQAEQLIEETIERFGKLDILVNNAGRGHLSSVEETTDEIIHNIFAVNVFALWHTTRPALRQMKKQSSGHIINVASIAGKIGYPFNSAYVAAKHACVGFTHALRAELAETGIHASVVCPAGVRTDWAIATEGSAMLPFFSTSGPIIKEIAASRNLPLPPIEGVLTADAVARKILECIHHPVAELYTHRGTQEFVEMAAKRREESERFQLAVALGERQAYESLMKH
jgi:uncharacterized protein